MVLYHQSRWITNLYSAGAWHFQHPARSRPHLSAWIPELEHGSVQSNSSQRAPPIPVPCRSLQCLEPSELGWRQRWRRAIQSDQFYLWESNHQRRRGGRRRAQPPTFTAYGVLRFARIKHTHRSLRRVIGATSTNSVKTTFSKWQTAKN